MQKQLFRQKSLDRISSPEQLQDYMHVTNPAVWMVLAAVIALLVGLIACSALGTLETTLDVRAEAENGTITVEVTGDPHSQVKPGMALRVDGQETALDHVYTGEGHTVCTASLPLPDGTYDAQIVIDAISPIRFLLD